MRGAASEDEPTVYAVRVAARAREALLAERDRRAEEDSMERAADWYDAVLATVRSLATYPGRCALAPEDELIPGVTVRQILHGRHRGQVWRILFTVHEANEDDPPTVRVYHVRHGAQAPLTEWPAQDEE